MKNKIKLLVAALMCGSTSAMAATATANLQVTATVSASCKIQGGVLDFAAYNFNNVSTSVSAPVVSTCSNKLPYTVSLSTGSGTYAQRTMVGTVGNNDKLKYNLYVNEANTSIWGDGTAGTSKVSLTGTGTAQVTMVNGDLPGFQFPTPDSYSDTVTITLEY